VKSISEESLTEAQNELYKWIKEYMRDFKHSPSIRQMMHAMRLKSPAPIQSRLKHLQDKGFISWQEGKARTLQIVDELCDGIPILGSIAAGGLVETFDDVQDKLDIASMVQNKDIFALNVNGDSMIDAHIAHGDVVLMESLKNQSYVKNGTIVSAYVAGLGTTLKYFFMKNGLISLEPANPDYEPIKVSPERIQLQGKLYGVWRKN